MIGAVIDTHSDRRASSSAVSVTQANFTVSPPTVSYILAQFYNVDHPIAKFNKHDPKIPNRN